MYSEHMCVLKFRFVSQDKAEDFRITCAEQTAGRQNKRWGPCVFLCARMHEDAYIYIYIFSAEDLGWMARFVCRLSDHRTDLDVGLCA